jgi:polygalacturonase
VVRHGAPALGGAADTVALSFADLTPATDYELLLPASGARLAFRTPACAGLVELTGFGARETAADNAGPFAAAVAATPPGGTLFVPAGHWRTAPVFLRGAMTLHLAPGAVVAAVADRDAFPILPARHADGRMLASWEGVPAACYAALLTAIDVRDLQITGAGVLDGGGVEGDWWSWPKETRAGARRARTIFLAGCDDVVLSGVTIRNSPSWTVHPSRCRRVTAAGLSILAPPDSPNTDGLNPESCEDVTIEGCRFTTGDDCIAIKAGRRVPGPGGADHLAPTRRVTIRNCRMERGHGAVVIGSEMSGDVTDVSVTDCEFAGTDRGLRIKSRRGRGGEVARVGLSRCSMQGIGTAIAANAFYNCDPDGASDAVQSRAPAPVDVTTPHLRDITVLDVAITRLRTAVGAFLGLPEAPVGPVTLRGIDVTFDPDAEPAEALMASHVAPMRHAGIVAENADVRLADLQPASLLEITGMPAC